MVAGSTSFFLAITRILQIWSLRRLRP